MKNITIRKKDNNNNNNVLTKLDIIKIENKLKKEIKIFKELKQIKDKELRQKYNIDSIKQKYKQR